MSTLLTPFSLIDLTVTGVSIFQSLDFKFTSNTPRSKTRDLYYTITKTLLDPPVVNSSSSSLFGLLTMATSTRSPIKYESRIQNFKKNSPFNLGSIFHLLFFIIPILVVNYFIFRLYVTFPSCVGLNQEISHCFKLEDYFELSLLFIVSVFTFISALTSLTSVVSLFFSFNIC